MKLVMFRSDTALRVAGALVGVAALGAVSVGLAARSGGSAPSVLAKGSGAAVALRVVADRTCTNTHSFCAYGVGAGCATLPSIRADSNHAVIILFPSRRAAA